MAASIGMKIPSHNILCYFLSGGTNELDVSSAAETPACAM
jgi:hypothetical protein